MLSDGSTIELGAQDKLVDCDQVDRVRIQLKNGRFKELTAERYNQYVLEQSELQEEETIIWEGGQKRFSSTEYTKYIAYRYSVEISAEKRHGLFTLSGDADLMAETQKLLQYKDCLMWSHIVSLERPDAQRTGYDCRSPWQNLITAKSAEIVWGVTKEAHSNLKLWASSHHRTGVNYMNYFKISSRIFDLQLSASERMVYCAIASIRNPLGYTISCAGAVAERTGLSVRTVYRAVERLQAVGLLSIRERYRIDGTRAANGYTVAHMTGGSFRVQRDIWRHKLDATSFTVYLYLLKAADNHTRNAYPSLRRIAAVLGLSKTTVIIKLRQLQARLLLVKTTRQSKRSNRYICNQYRLAAQLTGFICPLPVRSDEKKKERIWVRSFSLPHPLPTVTTHKGRDVYKLSLAQFVHICNRGMQDFTYSSYFKLGVVQLCHSRYYTHSGYSKRKKSLGFSLYRKQLSRHFQRQSCKQYSASGHVKRRPLFLFTASRRIFLYSCNFRWTFGKKRAIIRTNVLRR